jgi:MFS family permease
MNLLVADHMRAVAIAIVYLFGNLIGLGFGPMAAGALSDILRPWLGEESLRYALIALWPGFLVASLYVWRASKTIKNDLQNTLMFSDISSTVEGRAAVTST